MNLEIIMLFYLNEGEEELRRRFPKDICDKVITETNDVKDELKKR